MSCIRGGILDPPPCLRQCGRQCRVGREVRKPFRQLGKAYDTIRLPPGNDQAIGQHDIARDSALPGQQANSGQLVLQLAERIGKDKSPPFPDERPFRQAFADNQTTVAFQVIKHIQPFRPQQDVFYVHESVYPVAQHEVIADIERYAAKTAAPVPAAKRAHQRIRPVNAWANITQSPARL